MKRCLQEQRREISKRSGTALLISNVGSCLCSKNVGRAMKFSGVDSGFMKRTFTTLILVMSLLSLNSTMVYANDPATAANKAADAAAEAIDAANAATDAANLAAEAADAATVAAEGSRDIADFATVLVDQINSGLRDKTTSSEDRAIATSYSQRIQGFNSKATSYQLSSLNTKKKYDAISNRGGPWERAATSYLIAATNFERARANSETAAKNCQLIFETLTKLAIEKESGRFVTKTPTPTPTPTKSATTSSATNSSEEEEYDGEEFDEPEISASVKLVAGKWRISITSNIEEDLIEIKAKKKGSKSYGFDVMTKSNGSVSFTTSRKLAGYTLQFYFLGEFVTSITVRA